MGRRRLSKMERFKRKLKKISLWDIIIYPIEKILEGFCSIVRKIYLKILQVLKGSKRTTKTIFIMFCGFIIRCLAIMWYLIKILCKSIKWFLMWLGATAAIVSTCLAYMFNARHINIETRSNGVIDEL